MLSFLQSELYETATAIVLALVLLSLWKLLQHDQFVAVIVGIVLAIGLAEIALRLVDIGSHYQSIRWNEPKTIE